MTLVLASSASRLVLPLIIWIVLFALCGLRTLRRGHTALFIIGIFIPLIWVVGAFIQPRNR